MLIWCLIFSLIIKPHLIFFKAALIVILPVSWSLGCKWVLIGIFFKMQVGTHWYFFKFVILVHFLSQTNYVAYHSNLFYQILGRSNEPKKGGTCIPIREFIKCIYLYMNLYWTIQLMLQLSFIYLMAYFFASLATTLNELDQFKYKIPFAKEK